MSMSVERYEKILEGVGRYAAYYRANYHRFAKDYLHLDLRLFQKILLVLMSISTQFIFIASRGLGKSFLIAVFAVIHAILYPGSKIIVAAGKRTQAEEILDKIMQELVPRSPELSQEIKYFRKNGKDSLIMFKAGSVIKVVTSNDNARGNRANVLIMDEFRMINKSVVDSTLKKFLTQLRQPKYASLTKAERKKAINKEENKQIYLSSAYWQDSWAYQKCVDVYKDMITGKGKQYICGLPYELGIRDSVINKTTIEDDMYESDFNPVIFSMEYEALWFGDSVDGCFFEYNAVSKNRNIKYPMLPEELVSKLNHSANVKITPKEEKEYRILSADIALMSSSKNKNDATAIFINSMKLTKSGRYQSSIVYGEAHEGLRTDEQALMIRKMFDMYDCDYLVLDANGVGMGVYDLLAGEIIDRDTGEIYPALSCCNNKEMADRCSQPGAAKVIWAIKASAQFNSDCAYLLREGFNSGRIRLLSNEYDGEKYMQQIKGYATLSDEEKIKIKLAYTDTTLLINELTRLEYEEVNGRVKLSEKAGMRKDRYSSLAYNYYVAVQIENKTRKKRVGDVSSGNMYIIKPPRSSTSGQRYGVNNYGRKSKGSRNWKSGF